MSTLVEQKETKKANGNVKKLSKRQRQALKVKHAKLKVKKPKKKRKTGSKNIANTEVPSTSKQPNKTGDGENVPTTAHKRKTSSGVDEHSQTKAKRPKHAKNVKSKPKSSSTKTQQAKQKTTSNDSVSPQELEIEPDKNWKELAKKLGIDCKRKIKQPENPKEDKPLTEESHSREKVWFDDVEDFFIEPSKQGDSKTGSEQKDDGEEGDVPADRFIMPGTKAVLTKCLAMDCEMVGVGPGGQESALARISVVNLYGHCVYDKFVQPKEEVTDYRTWVSGVRPEDLETAETLEKVQEDVNEMFKGRILVGHSIGNDEKVLFMNHPKKYIRDTQKYQGFRQLVGGRKPGLKLLTQKVLGVKIQTGEHSSVQDAQATMRLYTMIRKDWEKKIKERHMLNKHHKQKITGKVKPKSKPKESNDEGG